jgi:hypothetical protein
MHKKLDKRHERAACKEPAKNGQQEVHVEVLVGWPKDVCPDPRRSIKKADVVERPGVFDHVGLLVNGSPGPAGLPLY